MTSSAPTELSPVDTKDEADRWLDNQSCSVGVDLAVILQEASIKLARNYVASWDAKLASESDLKAYAQRIDRTLRHHFWKMNHYGNGVAAGSVSLKDAIERTENGRLAFGKVAGNVLADVTLAEGCCRNNAGAVELFSLRYSRQIVSLARQIGGPPAVEFFDGFEAELMLDVEGSGARLTKFAGRCLLSSWLRPVLRNRWISEIRRRGKECELPCKESVGVDTEDPLAALERNECVDVLRSFLSEVVNAISLQDKLLLRMLIMDSVPYSTIATERGVHRSTIKRQRDAACRRLREHFCGKAKLANSLPEYRDCISWLLSSSPSSKRLLGREMAEALKILGESQFADA